MIRYESTPPNDIDYQSWLRRHIARLEKLQAQRIELVVEQKRQGDAAIERATRELDNLKSQLTIGVVK